MCRIDPHDDVAAIAFEHWLFGFCCNDWYLHLQYRCIPFESYCRTVCWQIYEYVISKNCITNNFIIAVSLAVGHQLLFCVQTFLFAFLYVIYCIAVELFVKHGQKVFLSKQLGWQVEFFFPTHRGCETRVNLTYCKKWCSLIIFLDTFIVIQ